MQKGLLQPDEVHQIRRMIKAGTGDRRLAQVYGVSVQTITRIRKGETWGWLPEEGDEVMVHLDDPALAKVEIPEEEMKASMVAFLGLVQAEGGGEGLAALNRDAGEMKSSDRLLDEIGKTE